MSSFNEFMQGFGKGTQNFGRTITMVVNSLLLSIVYFLGVGVTSLIARLVGKRFLAKKISKSRKTYWADLNLKEEPIEHYYKQY